MKGLLKALIGTLLFSVVWHISYARSLTLCLPSISSQSSVVAYNDYANLNEGQSVVINVLNNDIGLAEGVASLEIVDQPLNGTVTVNANFTVTYTPDRTFYGKDSFSYRVCNAGGACDEAIVDIDVIDVDSEPVAVNDTLIYSHGSTPWYNLLENDLIYSDWPISISIVEPFRHGQAEWDEDFNLVPLFDRNFGGVDSLLYRICDTDEDCSTAWVFMDVQYGGDIDYFIPNGFSPNGDGYNDTFYIPDFRSYDNVKLNIFNEWGQIVYQTSDYTNDWNGTGNTGSFKGKTLPSGTYYYIFQIETVTKPLTGYIYLSR